MRVLKNGYTSTLDIIAGIKEKLPLLKETLPDTLKIGPRRPVGIRRGAIERRGARRHHCGGADQCS